ncbi:sex hormone-binding globulin isoform X2 [Mixophyes fleayi]|uniref:sex hormone-binding globulin isoform X2 n=1 Tax=Mixophyes fleayi TaxID=3061075 RepID=UPI003F4D87F2
MAWRMTYWLQIFGLVLLRSLKGSTTEDISCHAGFLDPEQTINTGQKWGYDLPAGTVHIDLQSVTRSYSSFELRTFDPEGVLIFGDSAGGRDWFLLGLREGRPEIQIHNQLAKITINGGPLLNDGIWHKVVLRSEGHRIILEVDDQQCLRIGHVTERVTQTMDTAMRIAIGGILINQTQLLEPINTALDGCLRHWIWLSLTPKWLYTDTASNSSKLCFSSHRRGSYFPGSGRVIYRTKDLNSMVPEDNLWSLLIQMRVRSEIDSFSLLSVLDPREGPVISLNGKDMTFILEVGNQTSLSSPFPDIHKCDVFLVALEITDTRVTLLIDGNKEQREISHDTYRALRNAWQGDAKLVLGGSPEESGDFHGCLQDILVQGEAIDLDSALFRSDTIWSHSCP